MSYTALYRKFRPAGFEEVKGQDHIVTTLKNQIKSNRIGHAYLFTGTRGTGKTSVAKIFAKSVNCEKPVDGSPCGECSVCKAIAAGVSMNVIEIDAASNNGVDNIREIVDEVSYSPTEGKYKVYIIDEVHMLSIGAFNALLKTLEEPPSYVIFILATTEVHKIPITILSRCQRYDFRRISIDTIADRLRELMVAENVPVEEKALRYVAKMGDGSLRDALSLLDQCLAFHFGKELTYDMALDVLGAVDQDVFARLLQNIVERNVLGCITLLEEIIYKGRELSQFITDFIWYLRNILLVKTSDNLEDVIDASSENLERLKAQADSIEIDALMHHIRAFSELSGKIKYASQKRVMIEMMLIRLCKPEMEVSQDALLDRIRALEEKIESGAIAVNMTAPSNVTYESVPSKPVVKKTLDRAVPEDVKQVIRQWAAIRNDLPLPMKSYLKTAKLSLAGDDRLQIVLEDGLSSDYFLKREGHKEFLQDKISEAVDKQISIDIQCVKDDREFEAKYVDLTAIQFDIDEIDDDAEEFI